MKTKNLTELTDEQLALALQQGDQSAMGELYVRYYMLIFNKCLSFVKNTDNACDLAQDVVLKVMQKIGSFKGGSKFSTWLYAVTFNYCTDHTRKAKGKYFLTIDNDFELADYTFSYNEMVDEMTNKEKNAGKALSLISKEDKDLLLMKYRFNMSIEELQLLYNASASAIKMRLLRARAKAASVYNPQLPAVA